MVYFKLLKIYLLVHTQCCFKKETENRQYVRGQSPHTVHRMHVACSPLAGRLASLHQSPNWCPLTGHSCPHWSLLRKHPCPKCSGASPALFSLASRGFSFLLMSLYFSHKLAEYKSRTYIINWDLSI